MNSMAESWFHDGASIESFVSVILAPDMIMFLFPDWSCSVVSQKFIILYETCWEG